MIINVYIDYSGDGEVKIHCVNFPLVDVTRSVGSLRPLTAGSGDVLSGMIAGLMAQGNFSPAEAAIIGVYLHGLAGDVVADEVGEVPLVASDIIDAIPEALYLLDYAEEDE